jgi:hypothetical protein
VQPFRRNNTQPWPHYSAFESLSWRGLVLGIRHSLSKLAKACFGPHTRALRICFTSLATASSKSLNTASSYPGNSSPSLNRVRPSSCAPQILTQHVTLASHHDRASKDLVWPLRSCSCGRLEHHSSSSLRRLQRASFPDFPQGQLDSHPEQPLDGGVDTSAAECRSISNSCPVCPRVWQSSIVEGP